MNIVLTMSSFVFPLITFPYATRILQPAGMGKVSFAASLISYFSIFAQFGIPIYGIRECAKIRDDRNELSQTALELFIINLISSISVSALFIISIFIVPRLQQEKPLYMIMGISLLLNAIGLEWLYKALEEYTYIAILAVFCSRDRIRLCHLWILNNICRFSFQYMERSQCKKIHPFKISKKTAVGQTL